MKKKRNYLVLFLGLIFFYYQFDYKRYFICSADGEECFTIWKRYGHSSYIIPGKYYSPFEPDHNYIYVQNQYVGVIFNTYDEYKYKISVFPLKVSRDFDKKIAIYHDNDSLLVGYEMLKKSSNTAIREYSKERQLLREKYDYKLLTLETVYGVNILIDESN